MSGLATGITAAQAGAVALGAAVGALAGLIGVALLPATNEAGGFLTGLGFQGLGWLWPFALPPLAAAVAFLATRSAAFRKLRELT